jgi:hypothetical protein
MPHPVGTLLIAVVMAGCAGRPPAKLPARAAVAAAPVNAPRVRTYLDEIVSIELNRNCFGPSSRPAQQAPTTSPTP